MLVPLQQVVGTGYNAGLTATTLAFQPDAYAGAGFTSPSGRPIGGMKLGKDVAYRMVATAQRARYSQGPPALGAASEIDPVMKDRSVPYYTEAEEAARGAFQGVKAGWANKDCRALGIAALVLAYFLFGRK